MTTRPLPKLLALMLAAALSASCFSMIATGMQTRTAPTLHSIELPTVVIVAHKATAPQATAQTKPGTKGNA